MENPQQVKDKPKSRKVWLIVAGVVLACCVIVAIGAVFGVPVVSGAIQGLTGTQSVDVTTATLPADQSVNPASTATPTVGPAAGGRGDSLLKTDVWNSIVGFYASSRNCTDVASTKIDVTQIPDSSGVWQEDWTVLACGQTEVLKVKFTPRPQGGTDYHITQ
jgi:hypothetical protein